MLLTPKMPPYSLTTSHSEGGPRVDPKSHDSLPYTAFKKLFPKSHHGLWVFWAWAACFLTESQQWIWRGRRCGIGNKQKKAWKRDPECYFWNWVTWDKHPPSIFCELYSLELCFPTFKLWIKKVTILNVVKKVCVYTKSGSLPEIARDTFKKRNIKIMKQIKIKITY